MKRPRQLTRLLFAITLLAALSLAPQAHSHSTLGAPDRCAACAWSLHSPSLLPTPMVVAVEGGWALPVLATSPEEPGQTFTPLHGSRSPPR